MSNGLVPSAAVSGQIALRRALPLGMRAWGRVLDTSRLQPGDVLLTRQVPPHTHWVSQMIADAQLRGGYAPEDAHWTHAAIYLGDDEHLCEANFKTPGRPDGVSICSLYEYCDGTYAIKAIRPRDLTEKQRLKVAIGAMSYLNTPYHWRGILEQGRIAYSTTGFWSDTRKDTLRVNTRALVCTSLCEQALSFSRRGSTGRAIKVAPPAELSCSADFEDREPEIGWLELVPALDLRDGN